MRDRESVTRLIPALVAVLVIVSASVGGVLLRTLYVEDLREHRRTLASFAASQDQLISAVARFNALRSGMAPGGAEEATLGQIRDGYQGVSVEGETGEITLARLEGDSIVFLLRHRLIDMAIPARIAVDVALAEPMRRALRREAGTVVGLDYRGVEVVAAYRWIESLGVGFVVKIDKAELRDPFVRATLRASLLGAFFIALGSLAFLWLGSGVVARLKRSRARYVKLFEGSPTAFMEVTLPERKAGSPESFHLEVDASVTLVNRAAVELFEASSAEQLMGSVHRLLPTRTIVEIGRMVLKGRSELTMARTYVDLRTRAGNQRAVYVSLERMRRERGVPPTLTVTLTPVEALEEAQAQAVFMGRVLEETQSEIYIFDCESLQFVYVNPSACRNLGFTLAELRGMTGADFAPDFPTAEKMHARFAPLLSGAVNGLSFETVHLRKDGTRYPVQVFMNRSLLGSRKVFVASILDITERVAAEEARKAAADRARDYFDMADVLFVVLDEDAVVTDVNDRTCDTLGYSRDGMCGRVWYEAFVPPEGADEAASRYESFVEGAGEGWELVENPILTAQGEERIIEWRTQVLRDDSGAVTGTLSAGQDVTEQRETQEELLRSHEELEVLFENMPIAAMEGDFSEVKLFLDQVAPGDDEALRDYLDANPDDLLECLSRVRVLRINQAAVVLYGAGSVEEVDERTKRGFSYGDLEGLKTGLVGFRRGDSVTETNETHHRVDGEAISTLVRRSLPPGAEETWERVFLSVLDVTPIQHALAALRTSEALHRAAAESLNDALITSDEVGIIQSWNPAAETIFGYAKDEIIGQRVIRLIPERYQEAHQAAFTRASEREQAEARSVTLAGLHGLRRDGSEFPISFSVATWFAGGTVHHTAVIRDITEQEEAESALRESEAQYRELAERAHALIQVVRLDGTIAYVNDAWREAMGFSGEEGEGMNLSEFVAPGFEEDVARLMESARREEDVPSFQLALRSRSGELVWVEGSAVPHLDGTRVLGFQAILEDVTGKREDAERLKKLSQAVEKSPVSVMITDRAGVFEYVNPQFTEMLGYTLDEIQGRTPSILKTGHTSWEEYGELWRTILAGRTWRGELLDRKKNGSVVWVSASISPVMDEAGEVTHFIGVHEDITERRAAEEALAEERLSLRQRVEESTDELRQANWELGRAARAKDEFLASMSHELRTPLNTILTISESLDEGVYGPLRGKQTEALQAVMESGDHLLELINDILDLAKIEAGGVELNISEVNVEALCTAASRFVLESANKKNVRVSVSIDSDCGTILADERRLKQILVNLLANAVKFTPSGGTTGLEFSTDEARGTADFTVWDSGIGIEASDIEKLFKPFSQVDTGLDRHYEGTGLGLVLVARMAELHGGSVSVQSSGIGKGSRFTVSLPWEPRGEDAPQVPMVSEEGLVEAPQVSGADPQKGPLVLIVDDNFRAAKTLSDFLRSRGLRVVIAINGKQGLAIAREDHPALILMDVQMPGMSGMDMTRVIRQSPGISEIPIIMVTALAMDGDREACIAAGANDYFSKPVRPSILTDRILSLI